MITIEAPRPCPFCGYEPAIFDAKQIKDLTFSVRVKCGNPDLCTGQGPCGVDLDGDLLNAIHEAVQMWNGTWTGKEPPIWPRRDEGDQAVGGSYPGAVQDAKNFGSAGPPSTDRD